VLIASLVHRITEAGARTIGIDISFLPSATQTVPLSLDSEYKPFLQWLGMSARSKVSYSSDELFAMAIKNASNVVLPVYFEFKGDLTATTPEVPAFLANSAYLLFDDPTTLPSLPLLRGSSVFPPSRVLGEAAAGLGCINALLDGDGMLRNDPAIIGYGEHYFPSLGIQLVHLHMGLSWGEVKVNTGEGIQVGEHFVPIDPHGFAAVNYYGARKTFPYISSKRVMEGNLKPGTLRDKLVLVGVTAAGLHDLWITPFGPGYPGVEKHATVVANILDQRFVVRPKLTAFVEVAFMVLAGLVLAVGATTRRSWMLWTCSAILLVSVLAGSYWSLTSQNVWFKPLFPALLIVFLTAVLHLLRLRLPAMSPTLATESDSEVFQAVGTETYDLLEGGKLATIGRYQIEGELGHGAMGVVYKAVDPTIGRAVAINTIRLDHTLAAKRLEDLRKRSLRETQVVGKLSHPSIVTVYDVVEKGGNLFIAMEYIEGQELSHFCSEETLLKPRQVATIIAQVCDALQCAHKAGVVHRDIKPSNIMLPKDGRPKIMDFGITKIVTSDATQTAAMLGTPGYMSPEQVHLENVDARSDLFSIGAMFYELFCGRRPFTGPNITSILKKIATEDPPPLTEINPRIHPKLEAVVWKLLAKEPKNRFQSGGEVVSVLRKLLEEPSIWARNEAT
jgi:tRNA A-37 threonylcarbamoyl transferase component Bud32